MLVLTACHPEITPSYQLSFVPLVSYLSSEMAPKKTGSLYIYNRRTTSTTSQGSEKACSRDVMPFRPSFCVGALEVPMHAYLFGGCRNSIWMEA